MQIYPHCSISPFSGTLEDKPQLIHFVLCQGAYEANAAGTKVTHSSSYFEVFCIHMRVT